MPPLDDPSRKNAVLARSSRDCRGRWQPPPAFSKIRGPPRAIALKTGRRLLSTFEHRKGDLQMGLTQESLSVCNDGNVSQLDVVDRPSGDIYYRIEVYRCSQPSGGYGITLSGSRVEHICGNDHLSEDSNRTFRYIFAFGNDRLHKSAMPIVLEGREILNPSGLPEGSWEVRLRDLDSESPSYGAVLCAIASPTSDSMRYALTYDLRVPNKGVDRVPLYSPIGQSIAELSGGLPDLGESLDRHGDRADAGAFLRLDVDSAMRTAAITESFQPILATVSAERFARFRKNLDEYEAFGDFGSKAVHPGTNLTGPNARLAAESIFVRQYRAALVLIGRVSSPDMARAAATPLSLAEAPTNTRPGVYANFVGAAINNIGIYKLGLDKVHSDYGGIPMKLAPGSRLETGDQPVVDAWRCNQTLGELAKILYLAEA